MDLFEDAPGEFFISVEVFITTAASATLPKPSTKTRKLEKRESVGDDLKVKGAYSTLSLKKTWPIALAEKVGSSEPFTQNGLNPTGHWRAAICRLTEDKERCILTIYLDESVLHQTIFIHLLNQTDIRPTEQSLFYRKDCISILRNNGQPSNTTPRTHLAFPSPDTCATWQALLKSYAIPETYGRNLVPLEGGFYRLWRQVELTMIQGRNLGSSNNETTGSSEERSEIDVSCEIYLNDIICGCTTVQKSSSGVTDWHENFYFPGLPPFENLEILVWKDRKLSKPINLGSTCIPLCNFRRGESVEGWYPVVRHVEAIGIEKVVCDLRLKVRVDEEVILPYACYAGLMASCQSRNFLDWTSDLESRLKLNSVSTHFMSIAISNNTIVDQIQVYVAREVGNSPTSHQTLFRGNTKLTKIVELSMTWYGMPFLEASIGSVLRRLCLEKVAIEIDSARSGKGQKDVEKNVEQLIYWCQEFWNQIYSVRAQCPNEIKDILKTIRKVVEQNYRADSIPGDTQSYLPWQCVSAFIFLRFIVPAILNPHLFGLYPGLLPHPVKRSLTLIARVIQSLANLNLASHRDSVRAVQEFLKSSFHRMVDYITVVSTPVVVSIHTGGDDKSRHIRHVKKDLRQRTRTMATLNRESIPALPHLLDIPRSLACISSAVVRNSKESTESTARARLDDSIDIAIDEFCARCFEVEKETSSRVNRFATKVRSAFSEDADFSPPQRRYDGRIPSGQVRKPLNTRPATAASVSDFETHCRISRNEQDESTNTDAYPATTQSLWNHTESPSTESLQTRTPDLPPATQPTTTEKEGDTGKWKRSLFRGILKR